MKLVVTPPVILKRVLEDAIEKAELGLELKVGLRHSTGARGQVFDVVLWTEGTPEAKFLGQKI